MSARLKVMLADDHAVVRESLAALISREADMQVAGLAADGPEALRISRESKPDVALIDVFMPGMDGADVTQRLRMACPGVRVVAMTGHSNPGNVRRLLHAGATGYVLKRSPVDVLMAAIRRVAEGGTYVDPGLTDALVEGSIGRSGTEREDPLSVREEQVLRGVAWGRSNKEIAHELGISIKTVESYKSVATEKLRLETRADIVRYAVGRGWLQQDIVQD